MLASLALWLAGFARFADPAGSPRPVLSLIRHLQPDQILTRQDAVPIILELIPKILKEDVRVADLAAAREDVRHEDTVWVGGARPVLDARLRVAAQVLPVGRPAVAEGLGDARPPWAPRLDCTRMALSKVRLVSVWHERRRACESSLISLAGHARLWRLEALTRRVGQAARGAGNLARVEVNRRRVGDGPVRRRRSRAW